MVVCFVCACRLQRCCGVFLGGCGRGGLVAVAVDGQRFPVGDSLEVVVFVSRCGHDESHAGAVLVRGDVVVSRCNVSDAEDGSVTDLGSLAVKLLDCSVVGACAD